jgi:hypothetical protein
LSALESSDFKVDLYYPALPKPRTDQVLMIEVLLSSGTDTNRKKALIAALVEKLGEAGTDTNASWCSFWKLIVRADHLAEEGSHRLLPSLDELSVRASWL